MIGGSGPFGPFTFFVYAGPSQRGKVNANLSSQEHITVNIGQAAKASGISAKMIRYYETIGLVPRVGRTRGGYRDYDPTDIHRLAFVRRARDLGFSFARVRELLKLWSDQERSSADVKALALAHVSELETRAAELKQMIKTLRQLADACGGDDRPHCPIIEKLGSDKPQPPAIISTKKALRRNATREERS